MGGGGGGLYKDTFDVSDNIYSVCDVTLSVYPHRTSLKNMPGILAQCSAN